GQRPAGVDRAGDGLLTERALGVEGDHRRVGAVPVLGLQGLLDRTQLVAIHGVAPLLAGARWAGRPGPPGASTLGGPPGSAAVGTGPQPVEAMVLDVEVVLLGGAAQRAVELALEILRDREVADRAAHRA